MSKSEKRPLYSVLAPITRMAARLQFDLICDGDPAAIKGPAVVLVNHQSNADWMVAAYALRPLQPRFVVGRYHFLEPMKRRFYLGVGAIPKEQFYPDLQTIKMIKKALREGDIIALFPAGQSSFSGAGTRIPVETAKLLRHLAVPVFCLHINGAHLAFPKWDMRRVRRGRVCTSLRPLLTVPELMSTDEISLYERIQTALAFDDYEWQRTHRVSPLVRRDLEGLEHVLFLCPWCRSEYLMTARRNVLRCRSCGHSVSMDVYGFLYASGDLPFDTPTQWYRWQTAEVARQMEQDLKLEVEAALMTLDQSGRPSQQRTGWLTVRDGRMAFREERTGDAMVSLDLRHQPMLFQHESKTWFEFLFEKTKYRCLPSPVGATTKCVVMKELYYLTEKMRCAGDEASRRLWASLLAEATGKTPQEMEHAVYMNEQTVNMPLNP